MSSSKSSGIAVATAADAQSTQISGPLRSGGAESWHAVGLDVGGHFANVAVVPRGGMGMDKGYDGATAAVGEEVLADTLGERAIPCIIAGLEKAKLDAASGNDILVGNAAKAAAHAGKALAIDRARLDEDKEHMQALRVMLDSLRGIVAGYLGVPSHRDGFYSEEADGATEKDGGKELRSKTTLALVLTVPVGFTEKQRSALRTAATQAGFWVANVIAEPLAVAVAYNMDCSSEDLMQGNPEKSADKSQHVLVIDAGAGCVQVSLLRVISGLLHLVASEAAPEQESGGRALDLCLAKHARKELTDMVKRGSIAVMPTISDIALASACETCRIALSTVPNAIIEVAEGIELPLNRARFEAVCSDLLKTSMATVESLLEKNKECANIDVVLVSGGVGNTPWLVDALRKRFPMATVRVQTPEFAVVRGAAIEASNVGQTAVMWRQAQCVGSSGAGAVPASYSTPALMKDPLECLSLSIGVEAIGGVFMPVLARGSAVPCTGSATLPLLCTKGSVRVRILEGEQPRASANAELLTVVLPKDSLAGDGDPALKQVSVSISVDVDGNVTVTAREDVSGAKYVVGELSASASGVVRRDAAAVAAVLAQARSTAAAISANCANDGDGNNLDGDDDDLDGVDEDDDDDDLD